MQDLCIVLSDSDGKTKTITAKCMSCDGVNHYSSTPDGLDVPLQGISYEAICRLVEAVKSRGLDVHEAFEDILNIYERHEIEHPEPLIV